MKWFQKLERKYGKYSISNLMYYVIICYIIGFAMQLVIPGLYEAYFSLDVNAILHGQFWRMLTFLMQPPSSRPLFMVFALYLYYMIGRELEYAWGSFRFNFYFFMGVLLHILAAFVSYFILGDSLPLGTYYLNMSLFFAYAAVYPNQQFYLLMMIPIKVKWLAWIDAAYFGYTILQAFLPDFGGDPMLGVFYQALALEAFISLLNFLIFFALTRNLKKYSPKEVRRKANYAKAVKQARINLDAPKGARHRCTVCGRTELDDPHLEFRYCSKCNGNHEYCQEHLFTHEHIK